MDIKEIKSKFPIFKNKVKGKKLVYLEKFIVQILHKNQKQLLIEFLNFIQKNFQM